MNQAHNNANYDYNGARVLVTGGTNGIGYGIASAYREAGSRVTVTGTRPDAGDYDNDLKGLDYAQLRVQDRNNIQTVAAGLDGLDILVNNAGASLPGGKDEWEPDVFEESVRINLFSAFHMAQACQPLLKASTLAGGASIIGIASLTSFFAIEVVPGYGAAKAGLTQLTKTLGLRLAADNIRANAVAAGLTETRMTAFMKESEEINAPIMARTPLKRWGTPNDIAGATLFLTSREASFITGQTLLVDGGYSVVG